VYDFFSLLMVFLLDIWRLVIGRQRSLILVGWSILVGRVYTEFLLILVGNMFLMEVWCKPPIDPTIVVDIKIILNVTLLISIKYDINISGAAFALLLIVRSCLLDFNCLLKNHC
jgi:hypothetical protein